MEEFFNYKTSGEVNRFKCYGDTHFKLVETAGRT